MKISRVSKKFLLGAAFACACVCTGTPVFAQNLGSVKIGETSTATIPVTVTTAGTVGNVSVRLLGAENLDFTNAGGGTCAVGTTYAANATCTVKVTFAPKYAGSRYGAVVLFSETGGTGAVLASVPVYGIGSGPQIAFNPAPATVIDPTVNGEGLSDPYGVTVDGAGDLFIVNTGASIGRVVKVPADGGTPTVVNTTVNGKALFQPLFVAVDGAGNLFIADSNNFRVVEVPADGGTPIAIEPEVNGVGLSYPTGVAVDGLGDLFIGDTYNNRVVDVPASRSGAIAISPKVNGIALNYVGGVAVDGSGDLFIADYSNRRVIEVPAGGGAPLAIAPTVDSVPLAYPVSVSVDGTGDLFIGDSSNSRVIEVPAGGGAALAIEPKGNGTGLDYPSQVTVTGTGDLLIADVFNSRVVEVHRSEAPTVIFPTPTPVGSTDTTDGTQTVQVQNIGNQPLVFTGVSYPADFPEATGYASACAASTSLSAGQQCDLPIVFHPLSGGNLSESVTLTDNALNVQGSKQEIALYGPVFSQTITFGALPNVIYGVAPIALTATASSGLAISYSVTGPATLSGDLLTLSGSGMVAVTASQPGNIDYSAATPITQTFTVFLPSNVKLQSSQATATLGWPVTFTSTVSGSGPAPTGTVSFFAGSVLLGSGSLSGGVATFTTSSLAGGVYTVTAQYSGDGNYPSVTSGGIAETITTSATMTLTGSSNPHVLDTPLTLTATVEYPTGGPVPTGSVLFYLDGQHLGLATLSAGVATWQISGLAPGQHALGAQYGGDKNYKGIGGIGLWETVNKQTTTVTVAASPSPANIGQQVTITTTVATTLSGKTPTGTVKLFQGHALVGDLPLVNGTATYTTSWQAAGGFAFSAQYGGDSNYAVAETPGIEEYVSKWSTSIKIGLSYTSGATMYGLGAVVATIPAGHGTPTGTVNFYIGNGFLGSVPLVNGAASVQSIVPPNYGYYTFTAQYSGDANDSGGKVSSSTYLSSPPPR